MNIDDSIAIVTGGASGLGAATVERLIAGGGRVGIFDLNETLGQALAAAHAPHTLFVRVDVSQEASVAAGVDAVKRAFGAPHICVNCAGIPGFVGRTVSKKGPFPLAEFAKVIDVNLVGTFNVARLAAAEMLRNEPRGANAERGIIINTASLAAFDGQMGQCAYAASKAGIVGLTLPMTRDLSQFGVRVCAIAPGLFETPMGAMLSPEVKQKLVATLEFPKRMGEPAEFAALVAHLIENAYINGEVIRIDAGTRAPPR
ncbi:MAG TPA: SDR family NAD(P)-dependent oxidoreductase [Steroidobacteraceae bacterium]|nr:SDR family NAD(P)-dependent oxidoreductase [Steroidobacteraceae bacterium]